VEFGDAISPELNEAVVGLDIALAASELEGITDTVPSYRSLLICYEPLEISYPRLVAGLRRLIASGPPVRGGGTADWTVPVVYDLPYADDLAEVSRLLGLTQAAVIALHTAADFQVYTVGFAPGLPYLGGLPPELHISRRETPRSQVPVGAIMIGGMQAVIVSIPLPTGWYVLGRTPLRPFEPEREDPFLFRAGDHVRFRRIDAVEFDRLANLPSEDLLRLVRVPR